VVLRLEESGAWFGEVWIEGNSSSTAQQRAGGQHDGCEQTGSGEQGSNDGADRQDSGDGGSTTEK
jgi:hypothetical protein